MDELNIYFIVFRLTHKMDDPKVFGSFVQHTLIVVTTRVIDITINFADTFAPLLSSSDEDIEYLVKGNYE